MVKYFKTAIISLVGCVLLVCLARLIFYNGPVIQPSALPLQKIVDLHVHAAGIGAGGSGCYVSDTIKDSYKFDIYLNAFSISKQELERVGDQVVFRKLSEKLAQSSHVGKAVVLALDGVINEQGLLDLSQTEIYIPNQFVAEETAKYNNLLFGASINPYRPDALERLDQVKQQGAQLIKWIPSIQLIDPGDARIKSFYQKMIDLDLPLLTHTGQEKSFTKAQDDLADPLRLKLPLSMGVTVIAAHIATTGETHGEDNMQRILPMFVEYPNLYSDISSLTQINKLGYLNRALADPRVKGRLLYGSDFPLINMVLVSPYYFPLNLKLEQMIAISNIENVWDRDIKLKQALGVQPDVFARTSRILNLAEPNTSARIQGEDD
ncbi:MAG: amidohydrolase family protein [Methylococcales bacterium]